MPRFRLLPPGATSDAAVLLETRAVRALGDGTVSVVLAAYLTALGLSSARIGVVVAVTLAGSAALTLAVGLRAHAYPRRRLLRLVSVLMIATGLGFAAFTSFWPLALVGCIGTLNPSGGDVSVFLPTEQALLPATVDDRHRTALFARYSLTGTLVAAFGAALAGVPEWLARHTGITELSALRASFLAYALLGAVVLVRYRHLSPAVEPAEPASSLTDPAGGPTDAASGPTDPAGGVTDGGRAARRSPLGPSKRTVYQLAALFSLDALGGGFAITALLVLWLQRRFGLSLTVSGAVFFWAGLLSAFSQLAAVPVARKIGLIRTMAYTHLPANGLLMLTAFMPNAPLAVACLLGRSALSQMDVPARTSYVMAVVTPEERPAAASVTNVPRSLASAFPPLVAGWLLGRTTFGWPLLIGGALKAAYDLILLWRFRHLRPPEEQPTTAPLD